MAIERMAVTLHEEEIAGLEHILENDDREGALAFIRDVLEEKVKANELPHCVPFFDAGYNPGQADSFKRGE